MSGGCLTLSPTVRLLALGGRHVADWFEQALVVEAVNPLQGGNLHVQRGWPPRLVIDDFSLVQPDDRLR